MPLGIGTWSGGYHAQNSWHCGNGVSSVPPHPGPLPKGEGGAQPDARPPDIPQLLRGCSAIRCKSVSIRATTCENLRSPRKFSWPHVTFVTHLTHLTLWLRLCRAGFICG